MKQWKKSLYALLICLSLTVVSPLSMFGIPTNTTITAQAKSTTVYVTPTGKKYHRKKCGRGTFTKTTLAKAKGLTKCKKCYG